MSCHTRILRREYTGNLSLKTTDHCQSTSLLAKFSPSTTKVLPQERKLENGFFVCELESVLSSDECAEIIQNADKSMFENMSDKYRFGKQRNSSRLLVLDKAMAGNLWNNIEPVLSREMKELEVSKRPLGFDVRRGEWELHGLNEAMRINKYSGKKKEYFGPHKDAQYCPSGDERSVFTLLVYLNEGFCGGTTCFYFPKDVTRSTKAMTTEEEIHAHGGLAEGYDCMEIIPRVSHAVLFSQCILHESLPIQKGTKYVLKTDVVVKRHSKQFGFAVETREKDDYVMCLNYFREAQQEELKGNFHNASDLYERALSVRYCYPRSLEQVSSNTVTLHDEQSRHKLLPLDVWQHIFKYLPGQDAQNLVYAFPELNLAKESWEKHEYLNAGCLSDQKFLPKINYHKGIVTRFEFQDADFFRENEFACCRVAAMYSFFLLGQKPNDDVYLVRYNPDTQDVCAVALETLLTDVFYDKQCYGSFYNVSQQDSEMKNPKKDLEASVDRSHMLLRHGTEFMGVELPDAFYVKSTAYQRFNSDDEDEDEDEEDEKEEDGDNDKEEEEEDIDEEEEDNDDEEEAPGQKRKKEQIRHENQDEKTKECHNGSVRFYGEINESLQVDHLVRMHIRMHDRDSDEQRDLSDLSDGLFEDILSEEEASGDSVFFEALEEICGSKNKVSCTFVSKLGKPLNVEEDSVCVCFMAPEEKLVKYVGEACTTEFYNHLVFDFQTSQLSVKHVCNVDDCESADELLHPVHFKTISDEQELIHCTGEAKFYEVNIEPLLSSGTSFNHASCQCGNPRFEIHEYYNIKDYPYLDHIHLVAQELDGKMLVWTVYGGIVAL